MKKTKAKSICTSAIIAALYALLTYISSAFGLAFGPIQLRLSEGLTILPVFTPSAILGLTVGCFISNLASINGLDLIIGTLATLLSAISTRFLGRFKFKGIPIFAPLPPVIINSLFIGLELSFFYFDGFSLAGLAVAAVQIGIGELLACYGLGLAIYIFLNKTKIFNI